MHYTMKRYKREQGKFEALLSTVDFKNVPGFYGPDDKWRACEEIVLLTSLQHYSYGNWSLHAGVLSRRFNKKFTAEEVRDHYVNTYMVGDISEAMKNVKNVDFNNSLKDHTSMEDDEISNSSDVNAHESVPKSFLDDLGYMPLRQDFKEEYCPTAEDLIFDLSFKDADMYDKNFNLIVLDTYRYKINERIKLKKTIKEFRLVERFYAESSNAASYKQNDSKLYQNPEKVNSLHSEYNPVNLYPKRTRNHIKNHSTYRNHKKRGSLHSNELNEAEKELCIDLGLKSEFYCRYKSFLQSIDLKRVAGEFPNEIMIPEDMTVAQCLRIVNFMKKAGWIKTKNLLNVLDE